ncbi:unnamed protein product, partial [Ectocarpus sp. 12 AP-2014]
MPAASRVGSKVKSNVRIRSDMFCQLETRWHQWGKELNAFCTIYRDMRCTMSPNQGPTNSLCVEIFCRHKRHCFDISGGHWAIIGVQQPSFSSCSGLTVVAVVVDN